MKHTAPTRELHVSIQPLVGIWLVAAACSGSEPHERATDNSSLLVRGTVDQRNLSAQQGNLLVAREPAQAGPSHRQRAKTSIDSRVVVKPERATTSPTRQAVGSPGCAAANAPESGTFGIQVRGVVRQYILDLPTGYDPTHPYPLILAWHWRDGAANDVANGSWASRGRYYGLQELAANEAIFVAPQGIDASWDNPDDRDLAFAQAMLARFQHDLCVDTHRIFSTGFGSGGTFTYTLGCAMGDLVRGIAPISGSAGGRCAEGAPAVAVWAAHGTLDGVVDVREGRAARDTFLLSNNCGERALAATDDPCMSYESCDANAPLVWCEWHGDHIPPAFSARAIWDFFARL